MIFLNDPIASLPGVGAKYQKLLSNLDIYKVKDLLFHYPYRYDDFSDIKKIAEVEPNETVTLEGTLENVKNIFTKYGKRLTRAKLIDETGEIDIVWFNQHYLQKSLKNGELYRLSGKVGTFNKKPTLTAPTYELLDGESLNTGRLVPVYSETKGVTSKWLRARIKHLLDNIHEEELSDKLPNVLIKKYKLSNYEDAIHQIHFPEDAELEQKARKRLSFEELLIEMLIVAKRREDWHEKYKGIKLDTKKVKAEMDDFFSSLPFELTESQQSAITEIEGDLVTRNPMNRMLEGDVGSGKTMVAISASYVSYLNGYKTLYLAPTEILAKQHYETYKKFLPDATDIKLITGSSKQELNDEEAEIIIGTHALLFKEEFHNVGLVVIDEQHRFGVKQRAKIIEMGTKDKKPNLLTMTATPIPRTLALTIYGDLDISVLDTIPFAKKEIITKVVPDDMRAKTFKWIKSQQQKTFLVCPFITPSEHESFENVKAAEEEIKNAEKYFDKKELGLLHGKMKPAEKEKIIEEFREGDINILVSTPVIEVGVDIPDATIIVIESAERYGLASLHQLRGRVARAGQKGYCFLFMSSFNKKSYERLKNLEAISSGLKLAEIDMETRGQGDIMGTMQHGFKSFRIASLSDIETVKQAKEAAEEIYKSPESYNLASMIGSEDYSELFNN